MTQIIRNTLFNLLFWFIFFLRILTLIFRFRIEIFLCQNLDLFIIMWVSVSELWDTEVQTASCPVMNFELVYQVSWSDREPSCFMRGDLKPLDSICDVSFPVLCRWMGLPDVIVRLMHRQRAAHNPGSSPPPPEPWWRSGEILMDSVLALWRWQTWRNDSSSTVTAAVPGASADQRGAEAPEPGGSFSAHQPSSHQGLIPLSLFLTFVMEWITDDDGMVHRLRKESWREFGGKFATSSLLKKAGAGGRSILTHWRAGTLCDYKLL